MRYVLAKWIMYFAFKSLLQFFPHTKIERQTLVREDQYDFRFSIPLLDYRDMHRFPKKQLDDFNKKIGW